jgi:ParB-like chromosome segregation protein Spo0J
MQKLKIEYLPINEINPYENNAKLHPEYQIEQIAKSISEFGFNDPIAVSSTV